MRLVINGKEYQMVNAENVGAVEFLATITLDDTIEALEQTIKTNKEPLIVKDIIADKEVVREYNGYDTLHSISKQYVGKEAWVIISLYSPYNDTESLKVLAGGERLSYDQAVKHRESLEVISDTLDDDTAKDNPWLFPMWVVGKAYAIGDKVNYSEVLYKCVQAHTSQADWTPDVTPALWVRIGDPTEEWPEWIQPTGAHDAYNVGDKVSHNNKHWINTVNANVYEPGVYGWDEVTNTEEVVTPTDDNPPEDNPEPTVQDDIKDFEQPTASNPYKTGDKVRYNGIIYESLIDGNVWSPSDYPAGWKEVTE